MQPTKSVVAAISAGSLAIIIFVTVIILYSKGFFGDIKDGVKGGKDNSPLKDSDKSRVESDATDVDRLTKAIDDVKVHLGNNQMIMNALKTATFVDDDVKAALRKWKGELLSKIKEKDVLLSIFDALFLSFQRSLEKAKACSMDVDSLRQAIREFAFIYVILRDVAIKTAPLFGADYFDLAYDPVEYAKSYKNPDSRFMAMKILKIIKYEFESRVLQITSKTVLNGEDYLEEYYKTIQNIDTILNAEQI